MDEVESLFQQLKQVAHKPKTSAGENDKGLQKNEDLVSLDDDNDKYDEFDKIEKSLKQLPRLQNGFDSLQGPRASESKSYALGKEKKQQPGPTNEEWFTLPTPTGEFAHRVQRDLQLIKHRAALDPKRHYKKEKWNPPERFAVGTIIEDNSEFFSGRLPRKQRGETMFSTLLKDTDSKSYLKRKYGEIQNEKRSKSRKVGKKNKSRR